MFKTLLNKIRYARVKLAQMIDAMKGNTQSVHNL